MSERIELDTGALTVAEMRAILESIPADCTFADADNITRFYTGRHRIFDRSPALIGTNMIECHSEATRAHVSQLVSELATGWRDEAVFVDGEERSAGSRSLRAGARCTRVLPRRARDGPVAR